MNIELTAEGSKLDRRARFSTILGAIAGDYIGSRFEFNNYKSKDFDLFNYKSIFTDDTILTIAVYSAIKKTLEEVKSDDNHYKIARFKEILVNEMVGLCKLHPWASYGKMFNRWLNSERHYPYGSCGNGSAMRVSPIAYFLDDETAIYNFSCASADVTHNTKEGYRGAFVISTICSLALSGKNKDDIKKYVKDFYYVDFTLDEIRKNYKFDETCEGTVPYAIVAFLESKDYEDAIRNAISIGGDSDTLACITGAIAGAYYGVPESISFLVLNMLRLECPYLYNRIKDAIPD